MEVSGLDSSLTGLLKVGVEVVVMVPSHGIAHEVMNHLVVDSDASGRYSDRIRSYNLPKPGL